MIEQNLTWLSIGDGALPGDFETVILELKDGRKFRARTCEYGCCAHMDINGYTDYHFELEQVARYAVSADRDSPLGEIKE